MLLKNIIRRNFTKIEKITDCLFLPFKTKFQFYTPKVKMSLQHVRDFEEKNPIHKDITFDHEVSKFMKIDPHLLTTDTSSCIESSEQLERRLDKNESGESDTPTETKSSKREIKKAKIPKEKRQPRKWPTHFLAIPVDDHKILEVAEQIQRDIVSKQKELSSVMISPAKFHFTLMVMCLKEEEDIERAQMALEEYGVLYCDKYADDPFNLDLKGVFNFRDSVVFTTVQEGPGRDHLNTVAADVTECFKRHEIISTDSKGFNPHLTLAKMSKNSGELRKKGIKKIEHSFYEQHKDVYFGQQCVTHIQLCDMYPSKNPTGYYNITHFVQIGFPFGDWSSEKNKDINKMSLDSENEDLTEKTLKHDETKEHNDTVDTEKIDSLTSSNSEAELSMDPSNQTDIVSLQADTNISDLYDSSIRSAISELRRLSKEEEEKESKDKDKDEDEDEHL